ncbi:cytochrome c [Polaribacter sp. Z014]|uniref:c-type cytochrome n=1 Tax=unclassified Polaribacter TaxID=196858 RepID=UPI00193B354E|nr:MULTISPECIES: cytochrome c [unclassified Polaribacter]MCL7761935.1 cytochrome c [Polaribacter sp. Z014]QVY64676.1 cytochrome c [Polaribacter sp. Q13]
MKNFKLIIALFTLTSIISCNDKRTPQLQYMPDMYVSVPYDVNGAKSIDGEPVNREPVAGTIPRGGHPAYDIPNTNEGYELAKATGTNPLEATEENLANGKAMYDIYCISCHGKKGDGNGVLSQRDKFSGIPNYKDRDINAGSIYFVIMHGKNLMGSHASQTTYTERWQIVQYVEKLRSEL